MKKAKKFAVPIAAIVLEVLYPCLFIYFNNAGEAELVEVLPIWGIFTGVFLTIGAILTAVFRDVPKTAAVTALVTFFFMNFAIIEKVFRRIFSFLYFWHVAYILLIVAVIWAFIVKKYINTSVALTGEGILCLLCGVLILLNGVLAIPTITQKLSSQVESGTIADGQIVQQEDMPNVYLMIFDEYGGYDCLREYCDYDNAPFLDSLKELGFNASYHSYGKSISTHTEVPNLMNIDHITTDEILIEEKEKTLVNPALYQLFHQAGYEINVAGSGFLDDENCEYRYDGVSTKEYSAEYYIVQNTAYYPFYQYTGSNEINALKNHLNYVTNSGDIADSGLFTISYYSCPHLPWFVDENGDLIDATLRENWLERSTYTGELKYLNSLILPMMEQIISNDPDAVIMLYSDHGFRVIEEQRIRYDVDTGEDPSFQRNILNMVYYRGEALDIEGLSNIDTTRVVLNRLFGTDYEMLG